MLKNILINFNSARLRPLQLEDIQKESLRRLKSLVYYSGCKFHNNYYPIIIAFVFKKLFISDLYFTKIFVEARLVALQRSVVMSVG